MLVCVRCQTEYEEGIKFCGNCGGLLVDKEQSITVAEETTQTTEEKPKEKFICPSCELLYEKNKRCIKCGSELVKQSLFKREEVPTLSTMDEIEEEPVLQIQPLQEEFYPPIKEKTKRSDPPEVKKKQAQEVSTQAVKKEIAQTQTPGKRPIEKLLEDTERIENPPVKSKKTFLRLPLEGFNLFILAAIGIFLLWSIYTFFVPKRIGPSTPTSGEATGLILHNPSPPNPTSAITESQEGEKEGMQSLPTDESQEVDRINDLLEKIRQSNLQKNISLFMSCYSSDFKNRVGKKRATLETWKNFNYLDLSYTLKDYSIAGHTAQGKVEWLSKFYLREGSRTEENKTVMDVTFKKEDDVWKIKEIKIVT